MVAWLTMLSHLEICSLGSQTHTGTFTFYARSETIIWAAKNTLVS